MIGRILTHYKVIEEISREGMGSPGAADSYATFVAIKTEGSEESLVADAKRRLAELK